MKSFFAVGRLLVLAATATLFTQCARPNAPYRLTTRFDASNVPAAPDYADAAAWAALPTKADAADRLPERSTGLIDAQATADADVFFVHPTSYTYQPEQSRNPWNGDFTDATLNQRTDDGAILNQASIFNGSCRVYAPRYRQAHYHAFVTKEPADKEGALNLAYADVKAAFQYYLANYNQGRPIVIAAHSQGTVHATRLLAELFDGQPLQRQLVVAYLVGIATSPTRFKSIPPGESAEQTGCFVSWNTFSKDFIPDYYQNGLNRALCTNPLLWNSTAQYAPRSLNRGGVGLKFRYVPEMIDAESHQGLLWVGKPNVRGAGLLRTKIWHVADYNFFWQNTRDNVAARIRAFRANRAE